LRKQQKRQDYKDAWKLQVEGPEPLEKEKEAFNAVNQSVMQYLSLQKNPKQK